jgi:hypothetical protein
MELFPDSIFKEPSLKQQRAKRFQSPRPAFAGRGRPAKRKRSRAGQALSPRAQQSVEITPLPARAGRGRRESAARCVRVLLNNPAQKKSGRREDRVTSAPAASCALVESNHGFAGSLPAKWFRKNSPVSRQLAATIVVPALNRDPYAVASRLDMTGRRLSHDNTRLWLWIAAQGCDDSECAAIKRAAFPIPSKSLRPSAWLKQPSCPRT